MKRVNDMKTIQLEVDMSEQRPFKVGDDVFCPTMGKGKVVGFTDAHNPMKVQFAGACRFYLMDGKSQPEAVRGLAHANSGIIEIDTTLRPELEVDAKIWVRDSNALGWERRHFKSWHGEKPVCFDAGRTRFTTNGYEHTWNYYTLTDPNGEQD